MHPPVGAPPPRGNAAIEGRPSKAQITPVADALRFLPKVNPLSFARE